MGGQDTSILISEYEEQKFMGTGGQQNQVGISSQKKNSGVRQAKSKKIDSPNKKKRFAIQ